MTATQAPTPGPLSGDDDLLPCPFCEGDVIVTDSQECQDAETYYWHRCAGCGVESEGAHGASAARDQWNMRPQPFRLAPTAPVEASGSDWKQAASGKRLVANLASYCGGETPGCTDISPCCDCLKQANVFERGADPFGAYVTHLGDLLRPQPSGDTREAVAEIIEAAIVRHDPAIPLDSTLDDADRVLALIRPAPVAETAGEALDEGAAGEWPVVTDQWAETYCDLTGQNPDGVQVSFIGDGAVTTTFRDKAKRQIEAMLCAAPKAAVRAISAHPSPTPAADDDRVLDEAAKYLKAQYGASYGLDHPKDRAHILAALKSEGK